MYHLLCSTISYCMLLYFRRIWHSCIVSSVHLREVSCSITCKTHVSIQDSIVRDSGVKQVKIQTPGHQKFIIIIIIIHQHRTNRSIHHLSINQEFFFNNNQQIIKILISENHYCSSFLQLIQFSTMISNASRKTLTSVVSRNNRFLASTVTHHSRSASTLIVAEPTPSSSTELAPATLSSITAAQKLHSGPITILNTNPSLDTQSLPPSVTCVINTNVKDTLAETMSTLIQQVQESKSFTHILAPATKFGSNLVPRAAAMIDASPVVDVIDVLGEDTFIRPMYAGNALAKVQSTENVKVLSVRTTAFDKAPCGDSASTTVEQMETDDVIQTLTEHVSSNESQSDRPDLSSAGVVISGGRGLKDGNNFELLYKLADKLNGAVGASRAAVDAGFVPNDMQVGQTGKVVAPDLYIAVGISGAIQHLSGMKDSKTIVAINNDAEAPIFQVADYGLTQDLFKAVPELTEKV